MWSSSVYVLNIETEQDNEFKCVCVYLLPRTQIHTHTHTRTGKHTKPCCGQTHPISTPSFRKPQNQTHASLFQLPFFPPSSPHQIYLNSPTVSLSLFPPLSLSLSHIKCIHVLPSQTHARTCTAIW